jgi:hypothetical protein
MKRICSDLTWFVAPEALSRSAQFTPRHALDGILRVQYASVETENEKASSYVSFPPLNVQVLAARLRPTCACELLRMWQWLAVAFCSKNFQDSEIYRKTYREIRYAERYAERYLWMLQHKDTLTDTPIPPRMWPFRSCPCVLFLTELASLGRTACCHVCLKSMKHISKALAKHLCLHFLHAIYSLQVYNHIRHSIFYNNYKHKL